MEHEALSRYARDAAGRIVVAVATARVEDMFQDFDRAAPYPKKDLDDDFAEYVVDCVREVGRRPFVIRIQLPELPDEAVQRRVRGSIRSYFLYLTAARERERRALLRRSGLLFVAGLAALTLSLVAHRYAAMAEPLWPRVLSEGLTVAAWVALWNTIAVLLTDVPSNIGDGRRYRRISAADVEFMTLSAP
jgi:hypothetical protein